MSTATNPKPIGFLALLRNNRQIRQVWLAQVVSELGDWLNFVALLQIIKLFSPNAKAAGFLIILQMLPMVIVSPFAGMLADRYDRRKIMIISDLCRALIVLGFLTIRRPEQLWLLYLLSTLQFSLTALFEPARSALLPTLAKEEELLTTNALTSLTWSTILALGGALGGVLSGLFGNHVAFLVDAASFIVSASLLINIASAYPKAQSSTKTDKPSHDTSLGAALQYLRRHPQVLSVLLVKTGLCLTAGSVWLLSIIYGQRIFPMGREGAISVGILYGAHGLGAVIGAILTGWTFRHATIKPLHAIFWSFALRAIFFLLWGKSPNIWLAALSIICVTACGSFLWVASMTLLQKLTHDEVRGRLFALENVGLTLAMTLSTEAVGRALDDWHLSVFQTTLASAILAGSIALIWLLVIWRWPKWQVKA